MFHRVLMLLAMLPAVLTAGSEGTPAARLWEAPRELSTRDTFYGPWGAEHAPVPTARYRLVERKHTGVNPGMTVKDAQGRKWSVKQAPIQGSTAEGPIEVTVSRLLSAIGYLQPPVYFLRSFTLIDAWGTHVEGAGRFRLADPSLKDRGSWAWMDNPFVESQPYRGLLVVLMLVNSSDLKDANNTLYEHRDGDRFASWYVVRDLGAALGETGRMAPRKVDARLLAESLFLTGARDGYVEFGFEGRHRALVDRRITPADVRWAGDLLGQLTERQWQCAFRAGGYAPQSASLFIRALQARVQEARAFGRDTAAAANQR